MGAFRAVPTSDLRDSFDQPLDPRHGELWHLRDSGLVQAVRLDRDHTVVTLTKEGRDLLANSRMKDFFDIRRLAMSRPFDGETLRLAIGATFERRQTPLPSDPPLALTTEFG